MKKIEQLTEEQKALLPVYRDKWIKIGLSTEPANRPEAERGINLMYELAGLKKPKKIIWCDSPLTAALTNYVIEKVSKEEYVQDSIRNPTWGSVQDSDGNPVWNPIWGSVEEPVWNLVRDSIWDSVETSVWESIRTSILDSIVGVPPRPVWAPILRDRRHVCDFMLDSDGDPTRNPVRNFVNGQHDANWLGFYEYLKEVCGLNEETAKLEGLMILAKNAGWALPYKEVCLVCERHNVVKRDDRGRLHCEDGMALTFPDGWGIYAWHGVRVPKGIILDPEKITIDPIAKESNLEIRRVMCERYGWEKYFNDRMGRGYCKLINEKMVWNQPVRLFADEDEGVTRHFVHVINGTEESDGTKHQFIVNCKNIDNDAEKSVYGTYPELIEDIKKYYPKTWLQELRNSIRT